MTETTFPVADKPVVYIIHDNPEWIPSFDEAFASQGVQYVEWLLTGRSIDLSSAPPEGIFWSRLSASSHTRTDPRVKEYGRAVLVWLEAAGRTVINGSNVYELEVSKIRQHRELEAQGFSVPKTAAVFGHEGLAETAKNFEPPFITKHNQGGKGLGVRRFETHAELEAAAEEFAPGGDNEPIDGITLIQEYVQSTEPFITRAEFIGGRFHYAVKVDVSGGSFELCPAEACELPESGLAAAVGEVPGLESGTEAVGVEQFTRREAVTPEAPLIRKLEKFLAERDIQIAGVEFIETATGDQIVYDVNTNTNYNPTVEAVEREAGRRPAAQRIAQLMDGELAKVYAVSGVAAP